MGLFSSRLKKASVLSDCAIAIVQCIQYIASLARPPPSSREVENSGLAASGPRLKIQTLHLGRQGCSNIISGRRGTE